MQAIQIVVEDGVLKVPDAASLPSGSRLAVLVISKEEALKFEGSLLLELTAAGGAFEFLSDEPDLYSDDDILPERRNPRFRATGT
jgi:hypothetical protein